MSNPSDIMRDQAPTIFDRQLLSAGFSKPWLDGIEKPMKPEPVEERRMQILQVSKYDIISDGELKVAFETYQDKTRRSPFSGSLLLDKLKRKYNLPEGTEIRQIVDTSSIMPDKDFKFVMKLWNKDWSVIPDGDYLPVFNPTPAGEQPPAPVKEQPPTHSPSRRRSIITI